MDVARYVKQTKCYRGMLKGAFNVNILSTNIEIAMTHEAWALLEGWGVRVCLRGWILMPR